MSDEKKTVRISGYSTELPGDRSVFLGQAENDSSWYITFTNKGVENKIRISDEAMKALIDLHRDITAPNLTGGWQVAANIKDMLVKTAERGSVVKR